MESSPGIGIALSCVYGVYGLCTITIWVILLVFGLAGALSVSILLSVEIISSHVLLCRTCKTGETTVGYTFCFRPIGIYLEIKKVVQGLFLFSYLTIL